MYTATKVRSGSTSVIACKSNTDEGKANTTNWPIYIRPCGYWKTNIASELYQIFPFLQLKYVRKCKMPYFEAIWECLTFPIGAGRSRSRHNIEKLWIQHVHEIMRESSYLNVVNNTSQKIKITLPSIKRSSKKLRSKITAFFKPYGSLQMTILEE